MFRLDFFLDRLGEEPDMPDLLDDERSIFLYSFFALAYFGRYFMGSICAISGSYLIIGGGVSGTWLIWVVRLS